MLGSLQNLPFCKDLDMFIGQSYQHRMGETHENTDRKHVSLKSPVNT